MIRPAPNLSTLIESLKILRTYSNPSYPTHCEHDILMVCIDPNTVSVAHRQRLTDLGWHYNLKPTNCEIGDPCFYSYAYGS